MIGTHNDTVVRSSIRRRRTGLVIAGAVATAGIATYALWLRRWQLKWGATNDEQKRSLPGDHIVFAPTANTTRAITIDASPADIWPWLVQMGKGRGGLYSYDWLDIAFGYLDQPSIERILPEYQSLKAGDVIPIGRGESEKDDFYVHIADPFQALVIGANDLSFRDRVSWAMVLEPIGHEKTRLLVRVRYKFDPGMAGVLMNIVMEPASFLMLRKQMLTLKKLAERLASERN